MGLYYQLAANTWSEDATLAGADTLLAAPDEVPEETEEAFEPPEVGPDDHRPLLVVPDSRGRVRIWHALRQCPYWRGWVALVTPSTPADYLEYLRARHIDSIATGGDRVDLRAALEELNARYGVELVRVDSGGTLNGLLLRRGLVHEVSVLLNPSLVGGTSPRTMFSGPDLTSDEGTIPLRLLHVERLEDDVVWLRYSVGDGVRKDGDNHM